MDNVQKEFLFFWFDSWKYLRQCTRILTNFIHGQPKNRDSTPKLKNSKKKRKKYSVLLCYHLNGQKELQQPCRIVLFEVISATFFKAVSTACTTASNTQTEVRSKTQIQSSAPLPNPFTLFQRFVSLPPFPLYTLSSWINSPYRTFSSLPI